MNNSTIAAPKVKFSRWSEGKIRILSRHPSHNPLRNFMDVDVPTVLRLGSITNWRDAEIEINTVEAVSQCANKFDMKNILMEADVKSPEFWDIEGMRKHAESNKKIGTIIAKLTYRSRGDGMRRFDNKGSLLAFLSSDAVSRSVSRGNSYYFEKYYNYDREYRLHVTSLGRCFYTCRKMLKSDTPKNERWYRNDSNCVWVREVNELFDKPECWRDIVDDCVRALIAVGLDLGACDVRVNKDGTDYRIIEVNSAPSFGDFTEDYWRIAVRELYLDKLNKLSKD